MSAFNDQNFGEDEESDNDFQPGVERGSDAGNDSGNEGHPTRPKVREDSDDEQDTSRRRSQDVKGDSSSTPPKPKSRRSVDAEEINGDDEEELDEDNGEDDEGEGEDLDRDDEDDEEDEDEEDEGIRSRPKKRRRGGLNQFFEEEAEVDEDDDDLEGEDEGLGTEFIDEIHPDDDLPAEGDQDDRHHRELDRRRQAEASMDAEKRAQELKEKYGRRTTTTLTSGSFVPQNLLMHDVSKDPTLYNVRCREGKEKEIIHRLMKKFQDSASQRIPIQILSAFERADGPMRGCIFIEAETKAHAEEALKGIPDVYPHSRMQIVPSNEMPDCLRVNKSKELVNGSYVRIRRGLYSGDLAIVEDVVPNGLDVTVKLVPRLTYGLDEDDSPRAAAAAAGGDNKRKRPGFGTANNFANRPPPRPFNESEAKKKHARFLQQNRSLTGKSFTYRGDMYEDGFLIKDFKLQHLIVDNVQPKLEETQGFTKTGQDGTETLDLETLKHSLHDNSEGSYQVGDEVEVFAGEQRGIVGRTQRVTGNILSLKVSQGELKGQNVEVPIRSIRKRFRDGDNVIVVGGSKYRDQVGTVITIKGDKVQVLSHDTSTTIEVFSRDLREASGVAGTTERSKFDVRDLVELTMTTFGCVVEATTQSVRIMDSNGSIVTRSPSSISQIEVSRNVVAIDRNGSEIRPGDSVKEAGGEGKSGSILHIFRGFMFAHDRTRMIENAGIWVARCTNVIGRSARSGAPLTDLTKMNPAMQMKGIDSSMGPPQKPGLDRLIKKRVKINRGPYKGHRGIVKDTTAGEARIELESKNKIVNVNKMHVSVVDTMTQQATPYGDWIKQRGGPPGMQTGFSGSRVPDAAYGGRTPAPAMDGGRTPAWGTTSRTPAWGGPGSGSALDSSRTPAWQGPSGSRTSYGGTGNMTSYGGTGNSGGAVGGSRTPAWSSTAKTPYAGDSGFSASSSSNSAFDAFAAGSRTPAYAGMSTSSRTPAWGGPSAAASAPTPAARGYDAPTPAASAPTPGANRFDDDAYTPAYTGAPTPGAGFGNAPVDAPTPRFAKGGNTEPVKNNRFATALDAPTPGGPGAVSAPTPYGGGYDAPTPAAGGPRYVEDDDDD